MNYRTEHKNSTIYLDENELFIIEWKPERLDVEDFKAVVDVFADWSEGKKAWKVLHVFPKGASATSEGRNFGTQREKKTSAEAFVIENALHRNLFRLYQRFRSKLYPIRAFSNVPDAKSWLVELEVQVEIEE